MATTIKLSQDTKDLLDDAQIESETYDDTVRRLLGHTKGQAWTEQEIEDIAIGAVERELMQQRPPK